MSIKFRVMSINNTIAATPGGPGQPPTEVVVWVVSLVRADAPAGEAGQANVKLLTLPTFKVNDILTLS